MTRLVQLGMAIWTVSLVSGSVLADVTTPRARGAATPGVRAPEPASVEVSIDEAMADRRYDDAIKLIDSALPAATADAKEYLLFRRGLALSYGGKKENAIKQFDDQLAAFPNGAWTNKAVLRKGDALAALKRFEEAEAVYAERVRSLVGDGRKARIAEVYLEFAREAFEPTDLLSKPDFAKARTFYEKAMELEPGATLRDEILYRRALANQKLQQWGDAAIQYEAYLLEFDAAYREARKRRAAGQPLPPASGVAGNLIFDARLGLAECRLAMSQFADARRELQDLLKLLEGKTTEAGQVYVRARSLIAATYRMPAPPDAESLALGVAALEGLIHDVPTTKEAVQAAFDIGKAYAHLGRSDDAIRAFRALIDRTAVRPGDDEQRDLAEKLSQAALFEIGSLYFGQKKYADAVGAWNQYVVKYPAGPLWSRSQQRIVDAEFQIGATAMEEKRYEDARTAWTAFLEKYPLEGRAADVLYRLGLISLKEQEQRKEKGEQPDWNLPINQWKKLVNKFPQSEEAGHAQYMIGKVLEVKTDDLEGAIKAYEKVTWSSWQNPARNRIADMKAVRLTLLTARTFRTDETPRVRIDVRNIDKLTVKLYRIDAEDYFRKQLGMRGVESLDLLLIDPDKTMEVPISGFAAYRPITQQIEIPFSGPGVWAVYVSNENAKASPAESATPKRVEATTLLIRSDIDVIVKSSRRQALVYAQNMRTGASVENVRILVSDGKKVFLEGKTGPDGVWQAKSDKLKDRPDLSVFADASGHIAGTGLSLAGLGFSTGLQPRGFLQTDRPAYRPGDAVNIRGILREIKDGAFAMPKQPDEERLRWKLDVVDSRGRILNSTPIALSEFGTFAAQFRIPQDAPVGDYKLIARRPSGPTFDGAFTVQTYQLSKAYARFDFDERIVMRGTPIKGTIVLQYHYGEPVREKTVEYAMNLPTGDTILRSGVTDAEGKIKFDFDSTGLPDEGSVTLSARQAELDVSAVDSVFVAVRAFRAEISTLRPVVLSEEPVEVTVRTRDLANKPVGRKMTITALLRTHDGDGWSETKIETAEITTDAKSGEGRASLKLGTGGTYVLRAEGNDKFDHVVSAETSVVVSDKDDETRLRLFTDRQNYKVGESIAIDLHSRIGEDTGDAKKTAVDDEDERKKPEGPLVALVTFEGEEIIGYRTMKIAAGHNKLELPVGNEHFPNFAVSAAVMGGNKFYTASRAFTVERQLHITVTSDRKQYRPRDEMSLELTVTDQNGKPVEAEVGLAVLDDALLDRFPDRTPEIVSFFQKGAHREAEMRTVTSCTFKYCAATRDMVTEVLAEEERLQDQALSFVAGARGAGAESMDDDGISDAATSAEGFGGGDAEQAEQRGVISRSERMRRMGGRVDGYSANPPATNAPPIAQAQGLAGLYFAKDEADKSAAKRPAGSAKEEQLKSPTVEQPADQAFIGWRVQRQIDSVNARYAFLGTKVEFLNASADAAKAIRMAPPRSYFPETAYWNPHVVTDASGKATIKVVLPDSSTTWKIFARGVSRETLTGAGEASAICKHDFFVEPIVPRNFVEGDTCRPQARVHCLKAYTGKIDVTLQLSAPTDRPERQILATQKQLVEAKGAGVYDVNFDAIELPARHGLVLSLTAATVDEVPDAKRNLTDAVAQAIDVTPWGMRVEAHSAGVRGDSEFVEIEMPETAGRRDYHDMRLTIAIGTSMQRWLIEEALEQGPRWELISRSFDEAKAIPPRTHPDAASTLIGCLYVADYVRGRADKEAGTADMPRLENRIAGLVGQLLASQNEDGGWAWCGKDQPSDPWSTSHVAWALGKAKHDGFGVADAAIERASTYLKKAFADAQPGQMELKAAVLHGLSWIDKVDYAHANRLYRNRQTLSGAALGYLALTFVQLDRKPIAAELLGVLEHRLQEVHMGRAVCRKLSGDDNSAWMNSDLEATGLALLAQLSVDPTAPSVRPMVDYLASTARTSGWRPHKARGTVMASLATYYARGELANAKYALAISVNGREVRSVTSDERESIRIDLAESELARDKQRVDFKFDGRGEYTYAVTLSGFTTQFPTRREFQNRFLDVSDRTTDPPLLEYQGRPVQRGFQTAAHYDWFRNEARNVTVGGVTEVNIGLGRLIPSSSNGQDYDYVIVQETIPAGFRLLSETVQGNYQAFDITDNVLTAYYGNQPYLNTLNYKMVAMTPGTYRRPPTIIRSLYRPDVFQLNEQNQPLTVLPRGEPNPDGYRQTPDELYTLGRWHFDDGDWGGAVEYLAKLIGETWLIHDEPYRESIRMLLSVALRRDDADGMVNYFEILKEKYPDLVIPFDEIVRIAAAYGRTQQHERAYVIYRATADASFAADATVGGVLADQGRFLESIDFMESLWREYPDTPQVESIYFALSQSLYAKAGEAGTIRPRINRATTRPDAGREPRVTKAAIMHETIAMLERFLSLYPESPIADEASYSLANALLDTDDYDGVVRLATKLVERYPQSKWVDRFRYIQALAFFHQGEFEKAQTLARQVAASTYRDEQGVTRPSPNKWLATYMIGQIYHAQNMTSKAIEYYKKVRSQFSDAAEAVEWFEHRFVRLPEVTIFHPDEGGYRESDEWTKWLQAHRRSESLAAAGTDGHGTNGHGTDGHAGTDGHSNERGSAGITPHPYIDIQYRNIKSMTLQVYRVDLMKLALIEKNLAQITSVNLAGIKPIIEKSVELGDGNDYVDKSARIELNVDTPQARDDPDRSASDRRPASQPATGDGSGAYLVICRGDDLFASGLVLVTRLALEVQDDRASQRVRVNVVHAITREPLREVHVKVIGGLSGRFVSGDSDLRGVFVADAVAGPPTAIARDAGGEFAFYRSPLPMLAMAEPAPQQLLNKPRTPAEAKAQVDYKANLLLDNRAIQEFNEGKMKSLYGKQQRGVQVQQAE